MAGKKPEIGSTAETVAMNVKRVRLGKNLTYTQLSDRLAARSISPVAVRRIESVERRVDVDDLISIANALGVSPITLLMPDTEEGSQEVTSSAQELISAQTMWEWLRADGPPVETPDREELIRFLFDALPQWRRRQIAEGMHDIADLDAGGARADAIRSRYSGEH